MSSSICLALACKTRFWDSKTTLKLSQSKVGVRYIMWSYERSDLIHNSLDVAWASAQYSNSVLEHATSDCFFELHTIRLKPR